MNQEKVEAELAIRNVYAAYTFAVDDRDAEALADCFTADAEIQMIGFDMVDELIAAGKASFINEQGRVVGSSNIRAMSSAVPDNATLLHLTSNVWITRLDGDQAEARAVFVVLLNGVAECYGRYQDKLVRCPDGRWRFAERRDICQYERTRGAIKSANAP